MNQLPPGTETSTHAADDDDIPDSVGWDAIDRRLERLYGRQEPLHYAPALPPFLGGDDPLTGVSAYRSDEQRPHWHFVTYGFSDLYGKESSDPELSGFGIELTFRLARAAKEKRPPAWAISLLQNLARYVFQTGNAFGPHHYMNLRGPAALGRKTDIVAAAFLPDPQLRAMKTPNGRVTFLQVVGLTGDELRAVEAWDPVKFFRLFRRANPLLLTDLTRRSVLRDPSLAAVVERGARRDGSSSAGLYVTDLRWSRPGHGRRRKAGKSATGTGTATAAPRRLLITAGAGGVESATRLLALRIPYGRPFAWSGEGGSVVFEPVAPGNRAGPGWAVREGAPVVRLTAELAGELSRMLRPLRGDYHWDALPGLVIRVVPSEVTDAEGNVVQVIG